MDGWAYRSSGAGPDCSTFTIVNWTFSGINALDGETTNAGATTPFPLGTYAPCTIVETAPEVADTSPSDGATGVAVDADIIIDFSEDVNVNGTWFDITCDGGNHKAAVSGGPKNYTLNPDSDFAEGESCIVTISAANVTDVDTDDPPDEMSGDFVFSFTTFAPGFVINEIHADPASGDPGDANGDGTRDFSDDEFVELVNNSGAAADISGWTLSDGFDVRHTFPSGTVVPADCSVVVFGGGVTVGGFGRSLVQLATTGALGLNNGGDTVTLNDGVADVASLSYSEEANGNQSITRDPDVTGPVPLVRHTEANGTNGARYSPGTQLNGNLFSGCPASSLFIHDIQGSGDVSPYVTGNVAIEGIVVGDFQDGASGMSGDLNGFFIQEEDADTDSNVLASEGIFVFDGSSPSVDVMVGDKIEVVGQVLEFNGLTETTSFSGVTLISANNQLPTVTPISLPVNAISDFEAYESMYVTFPQTLTIAEYFNFDRFGEIVLVTDRLHQPTAIFEPGSTQAADLADLNARSQFTLDDGRTASNPDPAIHPDGNEFDLTNRYRDGDLVTDATGVINYSFGLYRIQPTQGATYVSTNSRPSSPEAVGGDLKVAIFNVLNYFTTFDTNPGSNNGPNICGPNENLECRGANDQTEFDRQRDKIISAVIEIDADIVGLIEIENNPTDEAMIDLVSGINDTAGTGTYAYLATGPIGTDAIKVAFIYKPANVSLVGDYAILDSTVDPRFIDTKNRPVLAQTFAENSTGRLFTVAVNHLKSKGSPCGSGDDDPERGSCNLTRTMAAEALVDWLASDPTNSSDADLLIIGDLNSYDKEDPIDAVVAGADNALSTGDDYTDLVKLFGGEYAYSYLCSGQLGYLDHALSNLHLEPNITGTTVWHINADEPDILDYDTTFKQSAQDALYEDNAYRSSDHDPVIVGLNQVGPICTYASPSIDNLWPANHNFVPVTIRGVTDPDGDPVTILIDSIFQDEAADARDSGKTSPDGQGVGTNSAEVRAERVGIGNGRVYHISFTANDGQGNACNGEVLVNVPLNQGENNVAIDDGVLFDSTITP